MTELLEVFKAAQNLTPRKGVSSSRGSSAESLPQPAPVLPAICDQPEGTEATSLVEKENAPNSEGIQVPAAKAQVTEAWVPAGCPVISPLVDSTIPASKATSERPAAVMSVESQLAGLRQRCRGEEEVFRRPAAKGAKKRPASCEEPLEARQTETAVRERPRSEKKKKGEKPPMKKPASASAGCAVAANRSARSAAAVKYSIPKGEGKPIPDRSVRLRMMPSGCSTCRRVPGCTPSCWVKKGWVVKA